MKTSEFKSAIESEGYHVIERPDYYRVGNKDFLSFIDKNELGVFQVCKLPDKVASVMMHYAYTAIEKRKDEKRWNVIIGSDGKRNGLTVWEKGSITPYYMSSTTDIAELNNSQNTFTDSEFSQLIEHLKNLPHGDVYAKIAELGKREVVTDAVD